MQKQVKMEDINTNIDKTNLSNNSICNNKEQLLREMFYKSDENKILFVMKINN